MVSCIFLHNYVAVNCAKEKERAVDNQAILGPITKTEKVKYEILGVEHFYNINAPYQIGLFSYYRKGMGDAE